MRVVHHEGCSTRGLFVTRVYVTRIVRHDGCSSRVLFVLSVVCHECCSSRELFIMRVVLHEVCYVFMLQWFDPVEFCTNRS